MTDQVAKLEAEELAEQPYDTSDPKQVNTARKKAARVRREQREVVRELMSTTQGRAWLYQKLEECHIWTPSFVPADPYSTAFKEGERNIGARLLADIMDAAPDQYVAMVKEAKEPKS